MAKSNQTWKVLLSMMDKVRVGHLARVPLWAANHLTHPPIKMWLQRAKSKRREDAKYKLMPNLRFSATRTWMVLSCKLRGPTTSRTTHTALWQLVSQLRDLNRVYRSTLRYSCNQMARVLKNLRSCSGSGSQRLKCPFLIAWTATSTSMKKCSGILMQLSLKRIATQTFYRSNIIEWRLTKMRGHFRS